MNEKSRFELAKESYEAFGVDVEKALKDLEKTRISIHCWQGDDVRGFLFGSELSGGIQTTGNYPGRASNIDELREDLEEVLRLVGGTFSLNLHAIYADTDKKKDLDELTPEDFASWVKWAKEMGLGLDFNPTCFSHPMAAEGFTLSSPRKEVRDFWIEHCKRCRKIGEYFGKELGIPCNTNIWIPDGMKDVPYDKLAPRKRLEESLDAILKEPIDTKYNVDSVESKLFGIGLESYTVGSHEFYLGYAVRHNMSLTLDAGHFHPTEVISDKLSAVSLFVPHLLLHVSRPVRWDSDHVVIYDDELNAIMNNLVRSDLLKKTSIGLDYFDASINRIAAWVVGIRSTQKALLRALLEPHKELKDIETSGNYTDRMYLTEHLKTMDFEAVYDEYLTRLGKPLGLTALEEIHRYEREVLSKRS